MKMKYQSKIEHVEFVRQQLFDNVRGTPEGNFFLYAEVMFELIRKGDYEKAKQCAADLRLLIDTLITEMSEETD
jgi:hypothetical protein